MIHHPATASYQPALQVSTTSSLEPPPRLIFSQSPIFNQQLVTP
ncbi:hypothetical protein VDG1235_246 [Verrucomicrobiia bacterium DG1235]|nr:hypothetical protein VDG1235_246 [Verrucomicrobiae bacterium DG1235]